MANWNSNFALDFITIIIDLPTTQRRARAQLDSRLGNSRGQMCGEGVCIINDHSIVDLTEMQHIYANQEHAQVRASMLCYRYCQ